MNLSPPITTTSLPAIFVHAICRCSVDLVDVVIVVVLVLDVNTAIIVVVVVIAVVFAVASALVRL